MTSGSRGRRALRALRIFAGAAALVAGCALAAFGSGRSPQLRLAVPISGSYALNTFAGRPMPAIARDTTIVDPWGRDSSHVTIVLTGGTVTLTPSGSYRVDVACVVELNGEPFTAQKCTDRGTYTTVGSRVTFKSAAGDVVAGGSIADGSLTVSADLFGAEALMLRCLSGDCAPDADGRP